MKFHLFLICAIFSITGCGGLYLEGKNNQAHFFVYQQVAEYIAWADEFPRDNYIIAATPESERPTIYSKRLCKRH